MWHINFMIKHFMHQGKKGITLDVKVTPGAKKDAIEGMLGERLKVRIAAKAVDGAANDRLIKFIAQNFNAPNSAVCLLSGATSRTKTLFIEEFSKAGKFYDQEHIFDTAQKLVSADPCS